MGCEPATAARADRARRAMRLLWPDRNPLRRSSDRVEAAILVALAVAFLAVAPLAVIVTGHVAYRDAARRAFAERIAWHQVQAVLLAKPVDLGYSAQSEAPARWTDHRGIRRTQMVAAPPGARPGSMVRVWTNAAGEQTGPPLTMTQVRAEAVVSAFVAPFVLGSVLLGAGMLTRFLLARRRLSAWDDEWRAIGPQWSRLR